MPRKLTISDVQRRISPQFLYTCAYRGSNYPFYALCLHCGHLCHTKLINFKRGHCWYCGRIRTKKEEEKSGLKIANKRIFILTHGEFGFVKYNNFQNRAIIIHKTAHPHCFKEFPEHFYKEFKWHGSLSCPSCHLLHKRKLNFLNWKYRIAMIPDHHYILLNVYFRGLYRYAHPIAKILHITESYKHTFETDIVNFFKRPLCNICYKSCKAFTVHSFKAYLQMTFHGEYKLLMNDDDHKIKSTEKVPVEHHSNKCHYYLMTHRYYIWLVRPSLLIRGERCPYNKNKHKDTKFFAWEIYHESYGHYKLCSKYVNERTKVRLLHVDCGKLFWIPPSDALQGAGCPRCRCSHGEREIGKILCNLYKLKEGRDFYHGYYLDTSEFCNSVLHADFYLPNEVYNNYYHNGIVIEFDGEQHFNLVDFSGKYQRLLKYKQFHKAKKRWHELLVNWEKIVVRDMWKNQYCKEMHIKMIRIPNPNNYTGKKLTSLVYKYMHKLYMHLN